MVVPDLVMNILILYEKIATLFVTFNPSQPNLIFKCEASTVSVTLPQLFTVQRKLNELQFYNPVPGLYFEMQTVKAKWTREF